MTHAERAERRRQMAQAVRKGVSQFDVARTFGVTLPRVRDACREHRVDYPERGTFGSPTSTGTGWPAILKRLLAGKSQKSVGRDLGISPQRVHEIARLAREAGVKIPRTKKKKKTTR